MGEVEYIMTRGSRNYGGEQQRHHQRCFNCHELGHTLQSCLKPPMILCYNCHAVGHKTYECKSAKRCHLCGENGHLAKACTQKEPKKSVSNKFNAAADVMHSNNLLSGRPGDMDNRKSQSLVANDAGDHKHIVIDQAVDRGRSMAMDRGSMDHNHMDHAIDHNHIDHAIDHNHMDHAIDHNHMDHAIDHNHMDHAIDHNHMDHAIDHNHMDHAIDHNHMDQGIDHAIDHAMDHNHMVQAMDHAVDHTIDQNNLTHVLPNTTDIYSQMIADAAAVVVNDHWSTNTPPYQMISNNKTFVHAHVIHRHTHFDGHCRETRCDHHHSSPGQKNNNGGSSPSNNSNKSIIPTTTVYMPCMVPVHNMIFTKNLLSTLPSATVVPFAHHVTCVQATSNQRVISEAAKLLTALKGWRAVSEQQTETSTKSIAAKVEDLIGEIKNLISRNSSFGGGCCEELVVNNMGGNTTAIINNTTPNNSNNSLGPLGPLKESPPGQHLCAHCNQMISCELTSAKLCYSDCCGV